MPIYCYKTEDGQVVEKTYQMGKAPRRIRHNRQTAYRDLRSEYMGRNVQSANWPQYSDAAGVHPTQIKEASAEMARAGVPTQFDSDGRAIFHSRLHRKNALRAMGLYDRNAGYGDPEPRNR